MHSETEIVLLLSYRLPGEPDNNSSRRKTVAPLFPVEFMSLFLANGERKLSTCLRMGSDAKFNCVINDCWVTSLKVNTGSSCSISGSPLLPNAYRNWFSWTIVCLGTLFDYVGINWRKIVYLIVYFQSTLENC